MEKKNLHNPVFCFHLQITYINFEIMPNLLISESVCQCMGQVGGVDAEEGKVALWGCIKLSNFIYQIV